MIGISMVVALIIGLPLGVLLFVTDKGLFLENKIVKSVLGFIVNMVRSIPFIILLVLLIPLATLLVGSATDLQLPVYRYQQQRYLFLQESLRRSFRDIDKGVIEAAISTGATPWMIIRDVLLPEGKSSIIQGLTLTAISLVAYAAMAGVVGGGGIGDLAIRFGYYRYDTTIMVVTVIILIVLVQIIQFAGDRISKAIDKR